MADSKCVEILYILDRHIDILLWDLNKFLIKIVFMNKFRLEHTVLGFRKCLEIQTINLYVGTNSMMK